LFSGPLAQWYLLRRWGLGLSTAALLAGSAVQAAPEVPDGASIAASELPAAAQAVHQSIRAGGPFLYPKDGTVFGNRERALPGRPRGYYREYTVPTPGARDRGGRRIVCGGQRPSRPDACYYTADHYNTFRRIKP
jgi:ribonuclease T1